MTKDEALKLALEALENSVDLVVEDAYNAEQLYGKYPARQGKVRYLKVLADQHKEAITAIEEALAQPAAQAEPEPTRPANSQEWAGMDGATAFHLITRHSDNWADARMMMDEWRLENPPAAQAEPYGYVWFDKNMEHRFSRMKPHNQQLVMDLKPIYETPQTAAQAEPQDAKNDYPFYELKFIMRVLDSPEQAPQNDLLTAKGMAQAIFKKWHSDRISAAQAESNEADQLLTALRLDPDTYRTVGGWLNIPKIMAAITSPADYPYTKEQSK